MCVWMRDLLGVSDDLEGLRQSVCIEHLVAAGLAVQDQIDVAGLIVLVHSDTAQPKLG